MLQPFKRTILRIHCWRDRKREKTQTLFQSVFVICRSHSFIYDKNVWISIEWLSSAVRQKFVKSCEAAKICFQKNFFTQLFRQKVFQKFWREKFLRKSKSLAETISEKNFRPEVSENFSELNFSALKGNRPVSSPTGNDYS